MIFRGHITQIVLWEQRGDYFAPWESKNGKVYDLICVDGPTPHFQPKAKNLVSRFFSAIREPRIVEDFPVVGDWFNIWIERPHGFKKGDIIEVEVTEKRIE